MQLLFILLLLFIQKPNTNEISSRKSKKYTKTTITINHDEKKGKRNKTEKTDRHTRTHKLIEFCAVNWEINLFSKNKLYFVAQSNQIKSNQWINITPSFIKRTQEKTQEMWNYLISINLINLGIINIFVWINFCSCEVFCKERKKKRHSHSFVYQVFYKWMHTSIKSNLVFQITFSVCVCECTKI